MNVLVLNDSARPIGGTEVYVRTYVRLMMRSGHDVLLITGDEIDPRGQELRGVRWRSLPDAFVTSLRPERVARSWPRALSELPRLLAEEKPDLVNLHLISAWHTLDALLGRVPVIRFVHTAWWYCPAGTRWLPRSGAVCTEKPGLRCLEVDRTEGCLCTPDGEPYLGKDRVRRLVDLQVQAHFIRRASLAVANSRFTAAELARTQGHAENVRVLYPPVDPMWIAALGSPPPAAGGRPILGIGRLERIKGFDHAVRALERLPRDVSLVLAGDGSQRRPLARLAAQIGVAERVRFAGWLSSAELREELARAWAVVFPSLWPEPFGQVGVQAMFAARPVVAYDAGGVREWIGDGEGGLLAAPNDVEALAEALGRAVRDHQTASALGASARQRAQRLFSIERYSTGLEELMHEATDRFRGYSARR